MDSHWLFNDETPVYVVMLEKMYTEREILLSSMLTFPSHLVLQQVISNE